MLKTPSALFLIGVVVFASDPAHAGDKQGRPNYYPLKEGSKWHYRIDVPGQGQETVVIEAAKLEKIDGVPMFRMEASKAGQVLNSEHLTSNDRGVFRHRVNDQPISKPVCVIKYPVSPGEAWKDEMDVMGQKMTMSFKVAKEEEVQVPAGKFKTTPIHLEAEVGGATITTTFWFAAEVGLVRQIVETGGQKMTMELEKYEKAK